MRHARILLIAAGTLSVLLGLAHFGARGDLAADAPLRTGADLVALSLVFAGLVSVSVALMAFSPMLLSSCAALFGAYYVGVAILMIAGGMTYRGVAGLLTGAVALVGAVLARYRSRRDDDGP